MSTKTTANKGIATSRAGRCYLRLRFAIGFGFGRTSNFGLLFVIFYFYIFIHQRLGADTAMNSLPAAIPDRWLPLTRHSIMKKPLALIIAIFFSLSVFSQTGDWYTYSDGGFCSTSILLINDGTYKYESGCEASSHVSFGTWIQQKDTIKFKQIDTREFKVLNILPSITTDSKILSVKIFDQDKKNITERIKVKQYVQGKGTYTMGLDSSKTIRTDFLRDSGIIIIESLEKLMNGALGVQVDSFTNFEITLNVPNSLIYNIGSNFTNVGDFNLLKTKDALLSVETYPADGNAKPFKIKYERQKK